MEFNHLHEVPPRGAEGILPLNYYVNIHLGNDTVRYEGELMLDDRLAYGDFVPVFHTGGMILIGYQRVHFNPAPVFVIPTPSAIAIAILAILVIIRRMR